MELNKDVPRAASRVPLWAIGGGVLLCILGCTGLLFWLMVRTGPLVERLIRESHAFEGAIHPRPAHVVPPISGTFAQAVEPLLSEGVELPEPELDSGARPSRDDEAAWAAWSRAREALHEQCLDVASGKASLETSPPSCLQALEEGRELMRRLLVATHAESGGLPTGAGNLSWTSSFTEPSRVRALSRTVELAALESRGLLAEGRSEQAVDTCLDALALSRELSLGGGLHGGKLSATRHDLAYRPCAAALDAAPLERKRLALQQLARLQQGWPSFSSMLREESVFHQLATFGPDLFPTEALPRLPPAGRSLLRARGGWFYITSRLGHPLLRQYLWRRNVTLFDAMAAQADLPPAERQRAFARLDNDYTLFGGFPGAVSASAYHLELAPLELQRLQAAMLVALVRVDLARAEQGQWPDPLPDEAGLWLRLEVLGSQEARLAPRDAALMDQALLLTADGAR